jgi:hypothetical protein
MERDYPQAQCNDSLCLNPTPWQAGVSLILEKAEVLQGHATHLGGPTSDETKSDLKIVQVLLTQSLLHTILRICRGFKIL